ncbi:hypothetical protein CP10743SC13_0905B, partial [Chlamydia psittaci 10_743_SC13]
TLLLHNKKVINQEL